MIGKCLGPYRVVAKLGEGGMAEVYRATGHRPERSVAIKVPPEAVASDATQLARFQREAEILALLNHPHVAQIYGLEKSAARRARSSGTPCCDSGGALRTQRSFCDMRV